MIDDFILATFVAASIASTVLIICYLWERRRADFYRDAAAYWFKESRSLSDQLRDMREEEELEPWEGDGEEWKG